MIKYTAIVLAAGEGKRMNAGENKQFIKLAGKPLIVHTLAIFDHDAWCQSILLVINPNERERIERILHNYPCQTPIDIAEGGVERQDSV